MLIWIFLGLIVGLLAVFFAPRQSSVLGGVILSVLGAVLGGFLGSVFFDQSSSFNLQILAIVLFGSILLVILQRSILR